MRTVAACGLLAMVAAGCGPSGPARTVVTGNVTYQGKAIADGQICFMPCDGTEGPSVVAEIIGGAYRADSLGGLLAGVYRVRIVAYRNSQKRSESASVPGFSWQPHSEQYIPAKYNAPTQLKITIAPGESSLVHDFALAD